MRWGFRIRNTPEQPNFSHDITIQYQESDMAFSFGLLEEESIH